MKKALPHIAGGLLGLCFLAASVPILLKPDSGATPDGTPMGYFMAAVGPTGYFKFVKWLELIGGLLVFIPRLRNIALLILGPIIVNIIAFNTLVADLNSMPSNMKAMTLVMTSLCVACALFLLWNGRKKFAALLN